MELSAHVKSLKSKLVISGRGDEFIGFFAGYAIYRFGGH